MSPAPLVGLRVVVTRPAERGSGLVEQLAELGADVRAVAAIAFQEPSDPGPLDTALSSLERFDWTVFTSATSVEFCLQRLAALGRRTDTLKSSTRIAAIGQATATFLEERGISVGLVPRVQTGQGLLRELAHLVCGKQVLLLRADIADPALPQGLRDAGAQVEEIIAYRTVAPSGLAQRIEDALAGGTDLVCFTSPSGVRNFLAALRGLSNAGPWGGQAAIIGPTTARAVHEAGLEVVIEAPEGSLPGFVDAMCRWWAGQRDLQPKAFVPPE